MSGLPTSSEATVGPRFRASQTYIIDDIATSIRSRQTVESTPFFSRHDPRHQGFKLIIVFGAKKPGYLSAYSAPFGQSAHYTGVKFSLFDDQNKPVKPRCGKWFGKPTNVEVARGRVGWDTVFKYPDDVKGRWLLICDIEYVGLASDEITEPLPDGTRLQKDLLKLFDTEDQADVTFVVQGELIKAHKTILMARCHHYERMFHLPMKESNSMTVNIPDIRPDVFREMLKFLYASQKPVYQDDITMDLLAAADKYRLEDLARMCETVISHHLSADNVIDALILADRCNCTKLMASALAVFRSQARDLKNSDQWAKLLTSPTLLLKLVEYGFE